MGSSTAQSCWPAHSTQLHLPEGSSPGQRARALQSPLPAVQEGEQGHSGKPPTAWIEHGADGRTNSAGVSVSHNLLPCSLPRLTFSSHGAGLCLEKATRKPGRVSERQVFCSEHHQGQYTRPQRIFLFFKNRHRQDLCCFVPFPKEFMSNFFSLLLDEKGDAAVAEGCSENT